MKVLSKGWRDSGAAVLVAFGAIRRGLRLQYLNASAAASDVASIIQANAVLVIASGAGGGTTKSAWRSGAFWRPAMHRPSTFKRLPEMFIDNRNIRGSAVSLMLSAISCTTMAATGSGLEQKVFVSEGVGAVARPVDAKMADIKRSVKDFGATGDGVANDTVAFAKAQAAGPFSVPDGIYVLDASPDPLAYAFTTSGAVTLKIGGVSYPMSNAFAGPWRYVQSSPTKLDIVHAKTGKTVMYLQDGSAGTATGFYRGLAFTTDSHFIQAQPATNGGSTDLLFQRSLLNADASGNRFNLTFEESTDRLVWNFATTATGYPAFDSAIQIYGGVSPALIFPGLRPQFNQGWNVQARSNGALKLSLVPGATTHSLKDDATGNEIGSYTRSSARLGGITFTTAYDAPSYNEGPQRWGGTFGDLTTALPVAKTLFTATGATYYAVIGTLRVAAVTSGGTKAWRESRFTYDGTTLNVVDLVNTLPVQIIANMGMSGRSMQFQASYAGGLGGGVAISVSVEWSHAGR